MGSSDFTDDQIIQKAIEEIETPIFRTTEQYLEVHEVVYEDGKPKVLRVDREKEDGPVVVYFPIKDERFYLAIALATEPELKVCAVDAEPYHSVYFRATSETMSFEELSSITTLRPTSGWSKGDKRKRVNAVYNFSSFHLEPNTEPDEFEDKLGNLLDLLEQDKGGILSLVDSADGYIQVVSKFHNGNTMLGGHHISKELIKRLAALNLEIDFDIYAQGNFFRH